MDKLRSHWHFTSCRPTTDYTGLSISQKSNHLWYLRKDCGFFGDTRNIWHFTYLTYVLLLHPPFCTWKALDSSVPRPRQASTPGTWKSSSLVSTEARSWWRPNQWDCSMVRTVHFLVWQDILKKLSMCSHRSTPPMLILYSATIAGLGTWICLYSSFDHLA